MQKHYIPSPEDFRIGFEYEKNVANAYAGEYQWEKRVFSESAAPVIPYYYDDNALAEVMYDLVNGLIRVPCLTIENIVDEGWHALGIVSKNSLVKKKEGTIHSYDAIYDPRENLLRIDDCHGSTERRNDILNNTIFFGTCRCINDFRLICKMLGIK